jgi:flagellar hook-associated protein 3 FlgL
MRVTTKMMLSDASSLLNKNLERLKKLQTEAASGKKLQRISDDPYATEQALSFRSALSLSENNLRNIDLSKNWMEATDAALSQLSDLVAQAHSIAEQGANDTISAAEREGLAQNIDEMLQQVLQLANARHRGQYIFGGFQTDQPPFSLNSGPPPAATYQGDNGEIKRQIAPDYQMTINVTGGGPFPTVFQALSDLVTDLRDTSPGAGQRISNRLTDLENASNEVLASRATMGARLARLDDTGSRLQQVRIGLESLLSRAEDADMGDTIMKLAEQEMAYRTALQVNSRVLQPSLLDFLT